MIYFQWNWAAPALAAAIVLVGYLGVWLFRWARWASWRRNFDKPNTENVRFHWDRKTRLLEIVMLTRRPWPFDKWTKARGFHTNLDQLLHAVPAAKLRSYVNKRLKEDRRKGQDK